MRRTRSVIRSSIPLLLAALVATAVAPAAADPSDRLDRLREKEDQKREQLATVAETEGGVLAEVHALDADVARVEAKVARLDAKLDDLDAQIVVVKKDLTEAQQRLALLTSELQAVLNRLVNRTDLLEQRAIALYKAGPTAYVEGLMEAETFEELASRYQYQQSVLEADNELLTEIENLRSDTEARRALVEKKKNQIAQAKLDLEADRLAVNQIFEERSLVLSQRQAALDAKELVLARIRADKARLQATIRQYEREEDSIESLLAAQASTGPYPVGGGQLLWPAAGPVVSGYGMRIHPIFGYARMHTGIDIGAPYGAPVIAADEGRVVFVGVMSGYGNVIVIDHGGGLGTTYNHLSAFSVASGQTVGRGVTIGAVGCTGWCTGPHLHFEVRVNGSPVDPMPYLE